ncbi:U32 family peptidase [Lachnobacterium bovis]|uniref:Putative protease n=1 Tax=Lachnobacterium bovis TaxID=140626 RepID=A0A1H9QQ94_9FIRM|nr:U32 family peptidase [Lachnobacterium bovis]SER61903.1 putative protease [Lachnobacterium bovis]
MNRNRMELLAPAGSLEIFKAVIRAGADAVYVGGSAFGARAYANNFSQEEMFEAIDYAHVRDRKVYMTVNTLMKNKELNEKLIDFLEPYYEHGLDAVIVQDLGAISLIRENFPDLPIHASTQTTVTGVDGAKFMKNLGVTRVVTAREMNLEEIKRIQDEVGVEIETFAHGALCYCYSGQCLLSSMLGGRSGNRGRCAQPCRLPYSVLDSKKEVYLNEKFVLSPKDQALIEYLPQMIESGVFSLKIEGRMKQVTYAAGVVSIYRKYLDKAIECIENNDILSYKVSKEDYQMLSDFGNRCGFTDGYLREHNGKDMITLSKPNHEKTKGVLQDMVIEKYVDAEQYIPIRGQLILHKESEAILEVSKDDVVVKISGNVVDRAQNRPLLEEDVRKRMCKTKDTPFHFETIKIDMDDDIFVPNGALNHLRRDALNCLKDKLLQNKAERIDLEKVAYNTKLTKTDYCNESKCNEIFNKNSVICSIESRTMLESVINNKIVSEVYLESVAYNKNNLLADIREDICKLRKSDKKAYFVLPAIYRYNTSKLYVDIIKSLVDMDIDGFVVKNYEEFEYICDLRRTLKSGFKVILDHNMYTYNDNATKEFNNLGADIVTVPIELNKREIAQRFNDNSEMIIYGYYALMTSAQCVKKTTLGCDKNKTVTFLKDRYNKLFPVKNYCDECYNVIYNTLPVYLLDKLDELQKMNIRRVRLNFTIESQKEITKILNDVEKRLIDFSAKDDISVTDFTRGHYKRGVE